MTNSSEVSWYFVNSDCFLLKCVHSTGFSDACCLPFLTSVICFPAFWPRLSICLENAISKERWWARQKWNGFPRVELSMWRTWRVCFRSLFSIWTMFSDSEGKGLRALVAYLLSCLFSISDFSHIHLEGSLKLKYRQAQCTYTALDQVFKPMSTCDVLYMYNTLRHVTCTREVDT